MITAVRKFTLSALTTLCVAVGLSYLFQPSQALTNDGSITAFGAPMMENFDSLAQSGTNTWTDNSTIKGTYSNRTVYLANGGGTNNGGLYSFGAALTNPIGDRAIGSVGSGSANPVLFGVRLTNNTGGTITSLAISYAGEQWRNGGNTNAHVLTFQYQVGNAGATIASGTWTTFAALNFTGPVTGATVAALDGNAAGNRTAISGTLPVTVNPGQDIWLRWQDPDDSGADHGLAVDALSVTAAGIPGDSAPAVSGTTPANAAAGVGVGANILVNFTEGVAASSTAFTLTCGSPQSFAVSGSPGATFTLNPVNDLPYSTSCTVTVIGDQVTDVDSNDPPDHMAGNHVFSFTTQAPPPPVATNVVINEFDADTDSTDAAEFIELYDGGVGATSLTGLTVVFFNGNNNLSYAAFDLDGAVTNTSGYFTLGNAAVPGLDLMFPGNFLQNGADAVALYAGDASSFPVNTPLTLTNLQDAVVYGTNDPDDAELLALLNSGELQLNDTDAQSLQRCTNGSGGARNTSTYLLRPATPDSANNCPPPPVNSNAAVVISQLYGGGGNSGATYQNDYIELLNRSGAPVDLTGWSLQYTSLDGDGWDFNKQPLGGTIGSGEYYLVALASGGATGAPLPAANVVGSINISGTSGKVALVNTFDGLSGNCPVGDPRIADFVGYGTADCYEAAAAASPSSTTALLRANNGATDFNSNHTDFATGPPAPRRTAPIVELGPLVLGTDPRINGLNAPRDATIQVAFTEPVDVTGAWFDVACTISGAHNSATFGSIGSSHFITPNNNFAAGEQCTVTLTASLISDRDTADAGANTDNLPADYTWSFTVAAGTAPAYPVSVHLSMGNPNGAGADEGQPDNFLMEKPEFALSYNLTFGRPNWVSWHLADEWVGTLTRFDTFRADPALPADWYRVQSFDFTGSGFDRGHMVPNADRDKETSIPINQATFLMSNMIAQAPDNNQGPWASLENYLRTLLPANELYIVAGGVGVGGTGLNGGVTTTLANGHVTVPNQTWKAALVLMKGDGDDVSRVTCSTRTIAVIMPNAQGIRSDPWENYLVSVSDVESLTGYDLFSNLPPQIQHCIEPGINGVGNLPLDDQAPEITCASPDGAWHADNISLSCTASDSGSGLANTGDASFALSTSVVGDIEDANASTGTRMVCDVAGNCATAGPIAGNQIDRKAPMITLITPLTGAWHASNVALAHTAADGGSGLASPGLESFSLVTSVVDDIEDANATTDAREVCDAVGNCAEAGPIGGIKIDLKDPVVTVITGPDSAWHADNIALAHTASDAGSGLASGGASFSLVTSVADGMETANASTDSRAVCDLAGNCVTAGPIGGNKIDRKAPAITLVNPPNGALYQLNRLIPASYSCGDGGSGLAGCAGTVANGAAIDTASAGTKTFVVTAADAAGNVSSVTASYAVAANTIAISNLPSEAYEDEGFVPAFAYAGDGAVSVSSTTAKQCTVSGGIVNFHKKGTCTLVAHAAATATFDAATGPPQSFEVEKDKPKKKDK